MGPLQNNERLRADNPDATAGVRACYNISLARANFDAARGCNGAPDQRVPTACSGRCEWQESCAVRQRFLLTAPGRAARLRSASPDDRKYYGSPAISITSLLSPRQPLPPHDSGALAGGPDRHLRADRATIVIANREIARFVFIAAPSGNSHARTPRDRGCARGSCYRASR
jgi:hypothetical protein